MTGRALPKPEPHACCPSASHLRVRSGGESWEWVLKVVGTTLPVTHCAWCGVLLPRQGRPRLRLSVVR